MTQRGSRGISLLFL